MANLIPISTVVVGSGGAASIEFTNIPQIYTDLKFVLSGRTSGANVTMYFSINSNTTDGNYSARTLQGNGSTATSGSGNRLFTYLSASGDTANTFGCIEMYFPNYSSANNKSFSADSVTETNGTTAYATFASGLWSLTSPINTLNITPFTGSLVQHSTATLYGIRKY